MLSLVEGIEITGKMDGMEHHDGNSMLTLYRHLFSNAFFIVRISSVHLKTSAKV